MTESQWLACDQPAPMLEALGRRASARKVRLFACACCRRAAELFPDDRCLAAVEAAERFADGGVSAKELADVGQRLRPCVDDARRRVDTAGAAHGAARSATSATAFALAEAAFAATLDVASVVEPTFRVTKLVLNSASAVGCHVASVAYRAGANDRVANAALESAVRDERAAQADILRDVFSDQFRPVVPDHGWFTSDVMALARGIYDERAFDRMPILADALQDAGCDSDEVLNHCRGTGAHARGCWVVDLILGKT